MSTKKHTPGPWKWHLVSAKTREVQLVHPANGWLLVMDFARRGMAGGQPRFATWEGEERGRMGGLMRKGEELIPLECHPDARLIAAAPDLLEALKVATNELNRIRARDGAPKIIHYGDRGPIATYDVSPELFHETVEACFAAIAKAEGAA